MRIKGFRVIAWAIVAAIILLSSTTMVHNFARSWMLESAHQAGEDRLLSYVSDIRRVLARFNVLPYLTPAHPQINALLNGEPDAYLPSQKFLAQMDKAASTQGWYVFNRDGWLVAASRGAVPSPAVVGALLRKIADSGGEVVSMTDISGHDVYYYLAAPVYQKNTLTGIAVTRFDLSLLAESWLAANEDVLLSNASGRFFLTAKPHFLEAEHRGDIQRQPLSLDSGFSVSVLTLNGNGASAEYLEQTVLLDDVQWRVHFLTPLGGLNTNVNGIAFTGFVVTLALIALFLYLLERRKTLKSREALQATVANSERRLRQMISSTNVGLVMLDSEGNAQFVNPTAQQYFNLPDTLSSGLPLWQLFDTSGGNSTVRRLLEDLSHNPGLMELTGVETMALRTDGSLFPVLFSMTELPSHQGMGYLVTVIDISKRKKAENALRELNAELEKRVAERTAELESAREELIEQQKLAAMGRMSSAITHELNQPLTGLKTLLSSSSLLIERGQFDTLLANMALVDSLIDRMAIMTTQLKTFAFNRPSELKPVAIKPVLDNQLLLHQARIEPRSFSVDIPENVPWVLGEKQRVEQAIGNLLVNALDATEGLPDGEIAVAIRRVDSGSIDMVVSDNGPGMDEESLNRVFEPFFTTKKMGEGLGLGLAITANSMRDMGGRVTAENRPGNSNKKGRGMTFTLSFLPAEKGGCSRNGNCSNEQIK
ncbi:ATP-binding protein [Parasalinivibrio latis]|uniref:PAS domain-containing sensor histidine kinase n=1 Tax=Parasalinivibrio latis TaxID=2952610 RepID=UPI0030E1270E